MRFSHGYPILFFDRQWLLQVLYDRLKHKDRVLLNKTVSRINPLDGGVEVVTTDGTHITGSLVIGGDGVHSIVRAEMFRLSQELQPGYFSPDEQARVPAYYQCSFGIAQDVPGWENKTQHVVAGRSTSQLVLSGPDNRVYWFFFSKLPTPKYGAEIPKYSKEDEAEFIKKYASLHVTENITFGQVYAKRLTSTLTPLHEKVYDKWFFNRIMTLGDAAHKV
jgi:2-polyprenyl-6-methoxyphenol hydroxylase-like FAD-dependent oxidoreductase